MALFEFVTSIDATSIHASTIRAIGPLASACDHIDATPSITAIDIVAAFVGLLFAVSLSQRCRRGAR